MKVDIYYTVLLSSLLFKKRNLPWSFFPALMEDVLTLQNDSEKKTVLIEVF